MHYFVSLSIILKVIYIFFLIETVVFFPHKSISLLNFYMEEEEQK